MITTIGQEESLVKVNFSGYVSLVVMHTKRINSVTSANKSM